MWLKVSKNITPYMNTFNYLHLFTFIGSLPNYHTAALKSQTTNLAIWVDIPSTKAL